jgi:twitching motility protein PilT
VTGPTGSGKSSTQAAIIDIINEKKYYHVVTIEDPIEYLHNTNARRSISAKSVTTRATFLRRCARLCARRRK